MRTIPQTVEVLDTLRQNCQIGKHRHFAASARTNHFHVWFGVPSVLIGVALGSTFFVLLTKEIPTEAKWAGAFGALTSALLSAIQTFFNFQKTSESHRTVANQYLSIQRECDRYIAAYCDELLDLKAFSKRFAELSVRYKEVNKAAEGLRTTQRDYSYALLMLRELEEGEAKRKILLHRLRDPDS